MAGPPAVGVTGGVGCGKSEVGRLLHEAGVAVLDADEVAHRTLQPGTPTYDAIVRRFGTGIVRQDGGIDRAGLAARVFGNAQEREALNAIVHPPVLEEIRRWVEERRGREPVAVIVPLLYEAGFAEGWDAVICVAARPEVVRERLRNRGWEEEEMARRTRAQWPLEEKVRRADIVIWNNGSQAELAIAVREAWRKVRERKR